MVKKTCHKFLKRRPIKCYHFLNTYNLQNNKYFFSIFRNINNEAMNFYPNGSKATYCGGESQDRRSVF